SFSRRRGWFVGIAIGSKERSLRGGNGSSKHCRHVIHSAFERIQHGKHLSLVRGLLLPQSLGGMGDVVGQRIESKCLSVGAGHKRRKLPPHRLEELGNMGEGGNG